MNAKMSQPPCEEVLSAFAVEPKHDSETLKRYLKTYPQFTVEIASLSYELSRKIEMKALSENDKNAIDAAWKKYAMAISVRPDARALEAVGGDLTVYGSATLDAS